MDIRGLIFYRGHQKWINLKGLITTAIVRIGCKLKGVSAGKGVKFYGKPILVRHPDSTIQIGSYSRFRSSVDSNLIGISKPCILSTHSNSAKIVIGEHSGISGSSISAISSITIGRHVLLGANTLITDFDWHNIQPAKRHVPIDYGRPIVIEDNVFIGYGSVVLKGVKIGQNSVIGANSTVSTDIPPNCVAGGNPCKVLYKFK